MALSVESDFERLYTQLVQRFGEPNQHDVDDDFTNYIFALTSRRDVEAFISMVLGGEVLPLKAARAIIHHQQTMGNAFDWDELNVGVDTDVELSVSLIEGPDAPYYEVSLILNAPDIDYTDMLAEAGKVTFVDKSGRITGSIVKSVDDENAYVYYDGKGEHCEWKKGSQPFRFESLQGAASFIASKQGEEALVWG